jgi:LDH2 family malate/lactate/ureidoglycolate dehydrogenase
MAARVFTIDRLVAVATEMLEKVRVAPADADTCARRLVEGDARGQRAHGLSRLPAYVRRIEEGGLNPTANPHLISESPVTALVDGENGLGPVVMTYSTELASRKARQAGLAWIGVRGSNHPGAGGVYAQLLVDQNLIAIIGTVANVNQMAPWGGIERLLGPNPLSIGVPAGDEPDIVLDMATTTVSYGTVRRAIAAGRPLGMDWLMDSLGKPIVDPALADSGTLVPIGGHKGYGISMIIAALAGTLNGAAAGSDVVDHYQDLTTPTNTGHFLIVANPQMFRPLEDFLGEMDNKIHEIRASKPQDGVEAVRIPGEGSDSLRRSAEVSGIEMSEPALGELQALATHLKVSDLLDD